MALTSREPEPSRGPSLGHVVFTNPPPRHVENRFPKEVRSRLTSGASGRAGIQIPRTRLRGLVSPTVSQDALGISTWLWGPDVNGPGDTVQALLDTTDKCLLSSFRRPSWGWELQEGDQEKSDPRPAFNRLRAGEMRHGMYRRSTPGQGAICQWTQELNARHKGTRDVGREGQAGRTRRPRTSLFSLCFGLCFSPWESGLQLTHVTLPLSQLFQVLLTCLA